MCVFTFCDYYSRVFKILVQVHTPTSSIGEVQMHHTLLNMGYWRFFKFLPFFFSVWCYITMFLNFYIPDDWWSLTYSNIYEPIHAFIDHNIFFLGMAIEFSFFPQFSIGLIVLFLICQKMYIFSVSLLSIKCTAIIFCSSDLLLFF